MTGSPAGSPEKEIPVRVIALAVAALGTIASLALAAPASAESCVTINGSINGTALPVNGSYCLPEAP